MRITQMTHIGMVNSYNIILGFATTEEVRASGLNVLSHDPEEDINLDYLKFMVKYFSKLDMFDECINVTEYIQDNYNEDGTLKNVIEYCECEYPKIGKYKKPMICGECDKQIRKW